MHDLCIFWFFCSKIIFDQKIFLLLRLIWLPGVHCILVLFDFPLWKTKIFRTPQRSVQKQIQRLTFEKNSEAIVLYQTFDMIFTYIVNICTSNKSKFSFAMKMKVEVKNLQLRYRNKGFLQCSLTRKGS